MNNAELRGAALEFVRALRELVARSRGKMYSETLGNRVQAAAAKTPEERQRMYHERDVRMFQGFAKDERDYSDNFKVDALALRDALYSRSGEDSSVVRGRMLYEAPANASGWEEIADDIERLAKKL